MREIPIYPPIKDGQLTLSYTDRTGFVSKNFANVEELAQFFRSNPLIAKHFGYIPKGHKPELGSELPPDRVRDTMKRFTNERILNGYADAGIHECAQLRLIEKISLGWVITNEGKKYLEQLEK